MSSYTPEALEAGRLLFAGPIAFERGVVAMSDLPDANLPEIAFAGRSNVGKSSLINALTGRKAIARASADPGRTRELNFFNVGGRLRLVDLPGYGYAKAPKSAIARWNGLMRDYLRGRPALKRVFVLIDARHGVKANDLEIADALDKAAVSYQAVLTKLDKISPAAQADAAAAAARALAKRPAAHPYAHATSAEKLIGIEALRAEIAALAIPAAQPI
ncbi:MAG: YihA family ribosome biogenesis GTP-binding protein [Alphaproteobacteria bacterium]|nr:YihA family ribosome biogenesis GTP-binding protein [Alphaproteobacteria bacterium]